MATTGSDGKTYDMLCMPVDKLPLWLATINPNKIKDPAIRAKVEEYQAESAIALHDYWTKGVAIRDDMDGLVTGIDPATMKALGGMVKGIIQKQMKEVVPAMVESAMLEGGHVVSTDFKPALEVLKECKVPPRKRRSFSQRVSSRLRRFSMLEHLPLRLSRETGRYLFHVEAIKRWLSHEGSRMIHDHIAALSGQASLHLVPPDPNKPRGGKLSRRGAVVGLAAMTIGSQAVVVDTQRYRVGSNEPVAAIEHDGTISIRHIGQDWSPMPGAGARFAMAAPRDAILGKDLRGSASVQDGIWVIGAVLS